MSTENVMSLWPEFQNQEASETPIAVLRQQAVALTRQTRSILEGYVRRTESPKPSILSFSFEIVAPGLGDYRFELLKIFHDLVPVYPVKVDWNGKRAECDSEAEFKEKLRQIFNDPSTSEKLSSLYNQSLSPAA